MQPVHSLREIVRYPLKSCQGESLEVANLEALGIAGDRQLILAEMDGRFISARRDPQLLLTSVVSSGDSWIAMHPKAGSLHILPYTSALSDVQVWGRTISAPRLTTAEDWFSSLLGRPVQLLLNNNMAEDKAAKRYPWGPIFSDGYPLLVCNSASLEAVNAASGGDFQMARFRPNLVIETDRAWTEGDWCRIQIGEAILRREKPCERCVLVTRDPSTGEKDRQQEPLKTLTRLGRQADGAVLFGENFSVEVPGQIRLHDQVHLLD